MPRSGLIAAAAVTLAACGHHGHRMHAPEAAAAPAAKTRMTARADLLGSAGTPIGSATFEQGPAGLLIRIEIGQGGLTPGWHGVHLHETGDCSDVGSYQLSGGHHGKAPDAHGLLNPDLGPEAGDLPNVWAAADGSAGYEAFTVLTDLAPALTGDGLAIIVHASADDHRSQPIGGAGARVACGVVR
jgi:superoxide dismutase, Cu-Zn family